MTSSSRSTISCNALAIGSRSRFLSRQARLTVSVESFPNRTAWESSVATAVALIRQGALDKVVLAREERLLAESPFSPISTLARLRQFDSAATLFAMQSGGSWFLGASPERLVRLRDNRVDVTCLAGSIGMGHDEEERRQLADLLLGSKKDREEHEIVVRSTMSALAEVCEDVTRLAGTPRVATARTVQHLETPVSARMSRGWQRSRSRRAAASDARGRRIPRRSRALDHARARGDRSRLVRRAVRLDRPRWVG